MDRIGWDDLPRLFPDFDTPVRWLPLVRRHLELIEAAAHRTRVTSVAPEDAVARHFAESLELLRIARSLHRDGFARCVDVGSGGGFPGLVIAIVCPDLDVHLVEPLQKRAALLGDIATALGLENVTVHAQRAEDAARGPLRVSASLVTARAVAPLRELLEHTVPFAATDGIVALPKGSGLDAELAEAEGAMRGLGASLDCICAMRPQISATVRVAVFRRAGELPLQYPRRAGVPARRPL